MFIIRRAKVDDASTLLKLAKMVHFINLPPDGEIITQKIIHSRNSFLKVVNRNAALEPEPTPKALQGLKRHRPGPGELSMTGLGQGGSESDVFVFVLEDTDTGSVLGSSQVVGRMGGPGNPNVSFRLEERRFFSRSLQTGTSHTVARMHLDETGPTEIGGLILQPAYRRHAQKLGRFLSTVRFHFVGLHRHLFADRMIAEMMAPITADGDNLLWEYLGRRFVPLSYDEADRFCQYSREFITSLLPREDIYLSLLPPAARQVVGEVGADTVPARRMLEKLGFRYNGFVDPFDGGPHLEASTDDIPLVRGTGWAELGAPGSLRKLDRRGIMSFQQSDGDSFFIHEPYGVDAKGRIVIEAEAAAELHARAGDRIGLTPTDGRDTPEDERHASRPRVPKKKAPAPAAKAGVTKPAAKASKKPRTTKKKAAR